MRRYARIAALYVDGGAEGGPNGLDLGFRGFVLTRGKTRWMGGEGGGRELPEWAAEMTCRFWRAEGEVYVFLCVFCVVLM